MNIGWVREMPWQVVVIDDLSVPIPRRVAIMPTCVFERIDDYTRSQPTAPSPGRLYRKALNWRAPDIANQNWWLYVCERAPDDPGAVDHHPFRIEIVDAA